MDLLLWAMKDITQLLTAPGRLVYEYPWVSVIVLIENVPIHIFTNNFTKKIALIILNRVIRTIRKSEHVSAFISSYHRGCNVYANKIFNFYFPLKHRWNKEETNLKHT